MGISEEHPVRVYVWEAATHSSQGELHQTFGNNSS